MKSVVAAAVDYIKNYQLLAIPRQGTFFYSQWLHFTGQIHCL
jgi:hypothetical protein